MTVHDEPPTHEAPDSSPIEDTLAPLFAVLDRLPFIGTVKRDAESLRALLYARRPPRIAVLGRPGAGKSALANALLGAETFEVGAAAPSGPPTWRRVRTATAVADWLELTVDAPGTDARVAESRVRAALAERVPDCLLVVRSAVEPEGELEAVLGTAVGIARLVVAGGQRRPAVLGVLTHADRLSDVPVDGAAFWEETPHPREAARRALARSLRARWSPPPRAVAFGAGEGRAMGVTELADAVLQLLPDAARIEAARALPAASRARRQVANRIVQTCSTLAITVGLAPVPLSDALLIGPLQVLMVSTIAYLAGRPWDRRTVSEWLGSLGVVGTAGLGLRWTFQQLVKVVPGAGTVLSGGVAGAGTAALGQSAIAYFLREPKALPRGADREGFAPPTSE